MRKRMDEETLEAEALRKSVRFLDGVDKRKIKKARMMEKGHQLLVRFHQRMWKEITDNASNLGMTYAAYIRMCVETKNKQYRAQRAKYLRDLEARQ